MRSQPLACVSRMGLPIALVLALACAEEPTPEPASGLLTDFATGVDAAFGVEAFSLDPATLTISSPSEGDTVNVASGAGATTDVSVEFTVKNFQLGKVVCYLDGALAGNAASSPFIFKGLKKGMHTLGCVLADNGGLEQTGAEARAVVHVRVVPSCTFKTDCEDGLACTQQNCVDGKCVYEMALNCCGSKFDCTSGEACLNPNTETSQCTACSKDADCDDGEGCTTDTCDLSGAKGVCKNTKADAQCCSKVGVGQCDDGKGCTIDLCDVASGKCKHVQPPGTCCASSECAPDDVCLVGSCVDNECRYGVDKFKPDCCSSATNTNCDDKLYCTLDKCEKAMTGGWMQCTHVPDPSKPNCCQVSGGPSSSTNECDDGQPCTWDVCTNWQCEHLVMGDCCQKDLDCDDSHPCTIDKCTKDKPTDTTGKCVHDKIPECCVDSPECNDGLYCTTDTCNVPALTCVHKKDDDKCCDAASECDDGKKCTAGYCINHGCVFGKDPLKPPSCCDSSADCNDGNACTSDACNTDVSTCVFSSTGDPNCCNSPADCDDQDCTTSDFCDAANQCAHKTAPYACKAAIDCDDGKPCTKNICDVSSGCGVCKFVPDDTCCEIDGQCDDGKPCTTDICKDNQCTTEAKSGCCVDDQDAVTACDDKNKCTIDYCLNNQCRHTVPKKGCCASVADCDDGDQCTKDSCQNINNGEGLCVHDPIAGCTSCTAANAVVTCDDNNACTIEGCTSNGFCTHTAKQGCCLDKFDCSDGNPCTYDVCVFNQCANYATAGDQKLCCSVETEAVDCAHLDSACAVGKCKAQPDGTKACAAEAKPVCIFDIGYCQDFSQKSTLKIMGWNPTDVTGTAATNWGTATTEGLGPDQHARLTWTPVKTNYDTCLTSPVFQAAGAKTITAQFDREFIKNIGTTNVRVLGSLDGQNADWTKATVIDTWTTTSNIDAETVDITLPPGLTGSNGLRLAFCVSGKSTFDLTKVGIDNFCIAKGSAPSFAICPPNSAAELGMIKKIPVKAKDPDANDVVTFSLVKAPSFVTISTALYYWLDASWNATISVNATGKDAIGEHEVTIKVSDGNLYKLCTFKLTILYEGGVLIWRPKVVPVVHSDTLVTAVKGATGKITQVIDDISLYADLTKFDAVFVLLGVYPDNYVLKESEIDALKLYLSSSGKGRLYLEGGDTWAFDKPTSLHSFFKVQGIVDSAPNGVTGPLTGNSVYNPGQKLSWGYQQGFKYNNLNDQIGGLTTVKRTGNLLRNDGVEKFWVHVGHDDKVAMYRTIGSSVLYSGVAQGDDEPLTLMKRIFNFFDNGFPDCKIDTDCDDGNACTTDVCGEGGDCSHSNKCLCTDESTFQCDQKEVKRTTNSGTFTTAVESYPCDPTGGTWKGNEKSYGFKSTDSKPITAKFTNVNNPNARVFVLKDTAKGCDPTGCVGTAAIVNGAATLTFAAAAGVQYHLVVDAPLVTDTVQYDLEIKCSEGEICDDGKDNNLNGLIDCYDLGSCCGDSACPEVCDAIDNNCDGTTDEGCDDDGDKYCDASMKVMKGALCTNSTVPTDSSKVDGDDCADEDGSVNPGAKEICANSKDDNCSGAQDELGAVGCVNYYSDLDSDGYGTGQAKCLCAPSGSFKATVANDCNDGTKDINPGVTEKCTTPTIDDNCNGSTNDLNAEGCSNFYTDLDSDGWGTTPFKCICQAEGAFKGGKPGDCDDAVASINPGKPEICNNQDDNCDGTVDEGCDDDGDKFCDADMAYDPTQEPIDACPKGAGDTDDTDPKINPEGQEICDNKDNDSDGVVDEDCNKDGDAYCDAAIVTVGTPKVCTSGGGDCKDSDPKINPGMKETCATPYDDNCNGTANDVGATNCTPYFFDGDSDKWGTSSHLCLCQPKDQFKAINPGDCKDADPAINPGVVEICDDIDNDCDGVVDNGCDEDGDGYCNLALKIAPDMTPKVCPSGGGDCDDADPTVNPSKAEVCGNGKDDNCNGSENDVGATGCVNHWPDADADKFGDAAALAKCICVAEGLYAATNKGDCDDKNANVNPIAAEKCDDIDNNCDGKVDEGCDDDKDGFCDGSMEMVGTPKICLKGGGDCNDANPKINKGITSEVCDGVDDDCNGVADNGCDKDQDGYCDGTKLVANPPPAVCKSGGGDCDDFNFDANPGAVEVCNNNIDDNCNGSSNDENAIGCQKFYFDADADKYGLNLFKCLCVGAGAYSAPDGGDCNDSNNTVKPGAVEVCDGIDNNCDGTVDEAGAQGCKDYYFDNDGDGFGLDLKKCLCAPTKPYSATKAGDCNDEAAKVYPGVAEVCDDIDNNCDAQVDEKCNKDGDKFCDAKLTVIGSPLACPLGGGDCDDLDATVSPAGNEICDDKDNNCNAAFDEGCDDDKDGFCDANMGLSGTSDKVVLTHDFEGGVPTGWTGSPSATGTNCGGFGSMLGGYNVFGQGAWAAYTMSGLQQHKALKIEFDFIKIDSWDGESGILQVDGKQVWSKSYNFSGGAQVCGSGNSGWNELKDHISIVVMHTNTSAALRFTSSLDQAANDESWGIDNVKITAIGSMPQVCSGGGGDCNDNNPNINPGQAEACGNTVDENCSGSANDEGAVGCKVFYKDKDADNYGADGNDKKCLCVAEGEYQGTKAGDCDDGNNLVNAGATEVCDGLDNNCDKTIDEGCDNDSDGYCDVAMNAVGKPPVCPLGGGDCNDNDKNINPGATEICGNNVDENCDGSLNSNAGGNCTDYYYDGDGDGFGVNVKQCLCTPENGFTATKAGDCDDSDKAINPDAQEVCGNGKDDNCNGTSNEAGAASCINFYKDGDKDGYGAGTPQCQCTAEGVYITKLAGDCDDLDANTHPGAVEICDGKDNACKGAKDVGCDDDGDGYCDATMTVIKGALCLKSVPSCDGIVYSGKCYQAFAVSKTAANAQAACAVIGGNLASIANQDENLAVDQARAKACGASVSAHIGLSDAKVEGTWVWGDGTPLAYTNWATNQPDNSGDQDAAMMITGGTWDDVSVGAAGCYVCELGKVTVGKGDDCADNDQTVNPGVIETCDDKDNNCDGKADEKCDDDKDGYCNKDLKIIGTPAVCAKGGGDCDDSNNLVHPSKAELCDDADNDCNGSTDEGCDKDADGYCDVKMSTLGAPKACPKGGGDCDDSVQAVNPGALEICDGKDNNCAAGIDEVCNDDDGDGYCKGITQPDEGCPKGGGDCDDTNKNINPGMKENCATDVDDNCNGVVNELGGTSCKNFYLDADADSFGRLPATTCDGTKVGANCYKAFKVSKTWQQASDACNAWGGSLTSVLSAEEAAQVKTLANGTCGAQNYWIGLGDKKPTDSGKVTKIVVSALNNAHQGNLGGLAGADKMCQDEATAAGFSGKWVAFLSSTNERQVKDLFTGTDATSLIVYNTKNQQIAGSWSQLMSNGYASISNPLYAFKGHEVNEGTGASPDWSDADGWTGSNGNGAIVSGRTCNDWKHGSDCNYRGYATEVDAYQMLRQEDHCCTDYLAVMCVRVSEYALSATNEQVWSDLSVLDYQNWAANQPDDTSNSPAGVEVQASDSKWNDVAETLTRGCYVCKQTPNEACLCFQQGGYTAVKGGDCEDNDPTVNPDAYEVCDGKDNDCLKGIDDGCDDDGDGFCAAGKLVVDVTKSCPKTGTLDSASCSKGNLYNQPPYIGQVISMNTYSHGGGYQSAYKEYWYPNWSSPYIYRFNDAYQYQGNFYTGQNCMMQVWADTDGKSTDYYTANWGYNTISKFVGKSSSRYWNFNIGSTAGGVATDATYVYAMRNGGRTVWVLNKSNGAQVKTFNLNNGYVSSQHGGMAVVEGKLFYGNSDRRVDRFDLVTGDWDGLTFNTAPWIYNMAFNGKDYCVSENNSSVYCYTLIKGQAGCQTGDDCDDSDKNINPGNVEICDDKDNNCDLIIDDKCDLDKDGYCEASSLAFGNCCDGHGLKGCSVSSIQSCVCGNATYAYCCTKGWDKACATAAKTLGCATCSFPSTCAKGGSDCDDKNSAIHIDAPENCSTPGDDNCDGVVDELNALGCVKYYWDGDGDGVGVPAYECRCTPNDKYVALNSGDCDDTDPNVYGGTVLVPTKSPTYIGYVVSMDTRSHGGGYSPAHSEYWYPGWAGTTVYRYNKDRTYLGTFDSGQDCMMQLWGDSEEDTYYTANWSRNTITKKKGLSNTQLWSYNIGSTAGGVASEGNQVYAQRSSGSTVWVINRANGVLLKTFNLSGGSISTINGGLAVFDGKMWRGNYNGSVYQYDMSNGQYTGNSFSAATSIYNNSWDGQLYCISANNSSNYCYRMYEQKVLPELCDGKDNNCNKVVDEGCDKDKDGYCDEGQVIIDNKACPNSPSGKANCTPSIASTSPKYVGARSVNTRSHGGGYSPKYKEFWYPYWSGTTVYRYRASDLAYLGAFSSGQNCMMQLWGEQDGTYYTANWDYYTVSAKQPMSSSTLWNRSISGTAGGVTADSTYVYAMRYYDRTVYRINKGNGNVHSTFQINGGSVTTMYGSLSVVNDKLWRGNYNRRVDRFDLTSGNYDGSTFYTAPYIYNMAMAEQDYCVSANDSTIYCYRMYEKGDCVMGNDCDDTDKTIFPSPTETICDDKDNNCNTVIDDGCDVDNDGYCDKNKATIGAPTTCLNGGGDCQDNNSAVHPGAQEICNNNLDDNCNNTQNEENAIGCAGWYYDGDQDGYALATNYRCLCGPDGLYTSKKTGDCDDTCPTCYPGAPEICDGKLNTCGSELKTSYPETQQLTIDTKSHGGGYAPFYKEYWYPQWSGATVYRYADAQGNAPLGTFNSGQSSIMQLWAADDEKGEYYTANWGYNKVYKWQPKSATKIWEYDLGSTAGGITTMGKFAYAMRNTGATVWMLERDTGKLVKTFNLSGGSISDQNGAMVAVAGQLFRGNTNGSVYRYELATGAYSGAMFYSFLHTSPIGQKYYMPINNVSFNGTEYCYSNNSSTVFCHQLTQPLTQMDVNCDKDGDGYCDANKTTIGTPPVCPKGGLDCNDGAKTIHPGANELCNASDDNCNGIVDEGAADTCNKELYQAVSTCDSKKGQCVILKCSDTFFDANGIASDGCECSGNDAWEPNNSCNASVQITNNLPDTGLNSKFFIQGKVVDKSDEDWYRFYAADTTDSGTSVCDKFSVRVRFLQNPGGLGFDVHRGACPTSTSIPRPYEDPGYLDGASGNGVCCGQTDFNWFTNFKAYSKNVYSSYHSEYGECPCSTNMAYWSTQLGYNQSPSRGGPYCKKWSNGVCIPRGWDYTQCHNDSNWFYVRVYKLSGAASCTPYQLEITNGIYGSPGHKGFSPK